MPHQEDDTEGISPSRPLRGAAPQRFGTTHELRTGWNGVAGSNRTPRAASDSVVPSGVVRDLYGSLSTLLTSTTLLAEDLDGVSAEKRHLIESMQRTGLLLQNRIENVLCAAAIWAGSFKIQPRSIRLETILTEVLPVVRPLVTERGQHLEVITPEHGSEILVDPRRLAGVFVNLILNASEQAAEGSTVGLHVRLREGHVRVSVADRGPGIPRERVPALFELMHQPLFALDGGRIALGLPIVRAIVEAHGGTVGARSRASGGARVWFEIPQTQRAAQ